MEPDYLFVYAKSDAEVPCVHICESRREAESLAREAATFGYAYLRRWDYGPDLYQRVKVCHCWIARAVSSCAGASCSQNRPPNAAGTEEAA